jgi:hypothetical protein
MQSAKQMCVRVLALCILCQGGTVLAQDDWLVQTANRNQPTSKLKLLDILGKLMETFEPRGEFSASR